eukprot:602019_1
MGNTWTQIVKKVNKREKKQVDLDDIQKNQIISYWLIESKFNLEKIPLDEICDIVLMYCKYFRFKKHEWFELSNDAQQCVKIISSMDPMIHEREFYPQLAGILFGDIAQNRSYSKYQCVVKVNDRHGGTGIGLIDHTHILAQFGGAPFGSFPLKTTEIPCTIWLDDTFDDRIQVTVDSKLKTLTITDMQKNKHTTTMQYDQANINKPKLCFFCTIKHTGFEIISQIWLRQ